MAGALRNTSAINFMRNHAGKWLLAPPVRFNALGHKTQQPAHALRLGRLLNAWSGWMDV